jgi:hypothetical protein
MCKPKAGVARKVRSHPCADPDGWQTANDEQHKKQMNNKYDIGQHGQKSRELELIALTVGTWLAGTVLRPERIVPKTKTTNASNSSTSTLC